MSTSWDLIGNSGTVPGQEFLGTQDTQPLVIKIFKSEVMRLAVGGNVGIGTASPSARLSVVAPGGAEISGTTRSTTLLTSAGALGSAVNSEQTLASFGFPVDNANSVSLGIRAVRTSVGTGWPTTAIGLGMDVDDTPYAGASLFLNAFGNVGIGTQTPGQKLSIHGDLSVFVPSSGNTIRALTLDVESFQTISNASGSHFLLVRDIDAAPPYGLTHFIIRGDGNVGIGTAAPAAPLDIAGGMFYLRDTSDLASVTSGFKLTSVGGSNYIESAGAGMAYATGADLHFTNMDATSTFMTIKSNGNVGIGTTTPNATLTVNGDVSVSGDVVLTGADCAEEFDIAEAVDFEPGTVMVIDQDGCLQQSQQAYDRRVAGVISGAGDYQPGLILDRRQAQEGRMPVALVGKVYCKVDAQYAPIEVGDLLTTSQTPGHAMKADDPRKAFGAVLGKALRGLARGQGLVPILVALQ